MANNGLSAAALVLAASKTGGGGGEPSAYLKNATVSGNTLTLTKKDDTTVTFTPPAAESEIFYATYGVTTHAEVSEAIDKNKVVIAVLAYAPFSEPFCLARLIGIVTTDTPYFFSCIDINHKLRTATLTTDNTWSNEVIELQDKLTAGTNITIDSNNVISATGGSGGFDPTDASNAMTEDGFSYGRKASWDVGQYSVALGYQAIATGKYSHSEGNLTKAQGESSHAEGYDTTASGDYSHAEGRGSDATGDQAHAEGMNTTASGDYSHAEGSYTKATKSSSHAEGENTIANGSCQHVQGKYNIGDTTSAFIIGNGISGARSNALTVDWSGNLVAAGTITPSGADYAEYFEWEDGNVNNEDRMGLIVALKDNKIIKANAGDNIIGVTSGSKALIGDAAEMNWSRKYVTDEFDRIQYRDYVEHHDEIIDEETGETIMEAWDEEIHAPIINPDYDDTLEYIPRSQRKEWYPVGLLGKIKVRYQGELEADDFVTATNGIAIKSETQTNIVVLEIINDHIARVLVR